MRVSGKVSRLYTKDWNGRDGAVKLYSFQVEGNNRYFRLGTTPPSFRETDTVTFEADANGNATNIEVTRGTGEPASDTGQTTSPTRTARNWTKPTASTGGNKDQYWKDKEQRDIEREERYQSVVEPRITYSSAQSDAVRLVSVALQHDMLTFGNANKSAKLGLLLDYVDQVTMRFAQNRIRAAEILSGVEASDNDDDGPSISTQDSGLDD